MSSHKTYSNKEILFSISRGSWLRILRASKHFNCILAVQFWFGFSSGQICVQTIVTGYIVTIHAVIVLPWKTVEISLHWNISFTWNVFNWKIILFWRCSSFLTTAVKTLKFQHIFFKWNLLYSKKNCKLQKNVIHISNWFPLVGAWW